MHCCRGLPVRDFLRECLSWSTLSGKIRQVKKDVTPQRVAFGEDSEQYFLYYEPKAAVSSTVIVWVHGGGWNAGSPQYFDFVGQCIAGAGYRFVSIGYRLSPRNKYPCQIADVCAGYNAARAFLREKLTDSFRVIVSGSSAGAHLASILCCSRTVQEQYAVDVSDMAGFIGIGGPYHFFPGMSLTIRMLLSQLFSRGYDRSEGEPCALMTKHAVPVLLMQSRHDGVVDYVSAGAFREKALSLGNSCELYSVTGRKDSHSWYTAGMFLESRSENPTLDKFFSWIEQQDGKSAG